MTLLAMGVYVCTSLQALCKTLDIQTVRIDGSVEASKRQDIVTAFNKYNVGKVSEPLSMQRAGLRATAGQA